MKINDIANKQAVNEGLGDFARTIGRGISGTVAGVQANRQANQGQGQINKSANIAFNNWNSKIVAGDPAAATDPEKLKQYAAQVASYYFKANGQVPEPPTPMTPANIKQYFVQIAGLNQTAAQGIKNTTPAQPAPAQPAQPAPAQANATVAQQGQQNMVNQQQPAVDANKDPRYTAFKNAATFKSAWDKYIATKSQPYQLIADPPMLTALKDMWMRSGGTKVESRTVSKKAQRLIEQRIMQDPIYESFSRVGRMIVEAELTQQQIQQLFKAVADGAAAGGNVQNAGDAPVNNRTLVGRGGDMVAKVAQAWDGVKAKISQSAPIASFDQAFDTAQQKLLNAAGGQAGPVGQALQKYKEFGQQHPIFQGAIYAGLIALAGISGAGLGGAALLAGIKTFDRLLQGDKASSALWRGFKTGAVAYGASNLLNPGQPTGSDNPVVGPDGNTVVPPGGDGTVPPGGEEIVNTPYDFIANSHEYVVKPGDTVSQILDKAGVNPELAAKLNPDLFGNGGNPNILHPGDIIRMPNADALPTMEKLVYQGTGSYDPTGSMYHGQYAPNNQYSLDANQIQRQIDRGQYGTDNGMAAARIAQDAGGAPTNAGAGQANPQSAATLRTPPYAVDNGNGPEVIPRPKSSFDAGGVNPQDQAMLANNPAIQAANSKIDVADAASYNKAAQEYMQQQIEDGRNADKALTKWATSQGLDKSDLVSGIAKDENGNFYPGWSQPKGSDWYTYNPKNDPNMTYPDNFRISTKSMSNSSYINPRAMISEYVDYNATMHGRMLSEMRGVAHNGFYLTPVGVNAIFEGVVAEGAWDTIKNVGSKIAGGVEKFGQGVADVAKKGYDAAANKITLDKLDLNWRKNYKEFDPTGGKGPVDSEQVKAFLRKQGVTDVLINKVFGELGLDATQPDPTQSPAQPQASAGGVFAGGGPSFTAMFKQFSDGGGNLAPQVRGVLKDILLTAVRTVESMQRKRMYGAPVLSEVKTDFSAALLKTLR
jgi:hypothetical protein